MGAIGTFIGKRKLADCASPLLAAAVSESVDLTRFGISEVSVNVTSFAAVKTYRLITGEGHSYSYGDTLETSQQAQVAPGGVGMMVGR